MDKKIYLKSKRSQEEMVGFALIVIIVSIIILIFINFSIKQDIKEPLESYEAESFIQALLQYTSECQDYLGYLSLQKVIIKCNNQEECLDGEEACEKLNETLTQLIEESWKVGNNRVIKGYYLNITEGERTMIFLGEGDTTNNYKGTVQSLGNNNIQIRFVSYY